MAKYIKLEDAINRDCILIDKIKCDDCLFYDKEPFLCRIVEWLESLPTIDIIECKDCKHYISDSGALMMCEVHNGLLVYDNEFCSYAERRDNE